MPQPPALPSDPLARFCALSRAFLAGRRFADSWTILRHSALILTATPGDPGEILREVRAQHAALRKGAGWFGGMEGSLGFALAVMLVRTGDRAADFLAELKRVQARFRERKLRRGGTSERLAIVVLRELSEHGRVDAARVKRFDELYRATRAAHPFLTDTSDYPSVALLTTSEEPVPTVVQRVESLYRTLRAQRFAAGNALQTATHILFFSPEPDAAAARRFVELYRGFQGAGLRMFSEDHDEVALLALLQAPSERVVRCVLEHRATIAAERPRPGRQPGFELACGTAFLELARTDSRLRRLSSLQAALRVQALLRAQQAAVLAAAGGATAAAAAS